MSEKSDTSTSSLSAALLRGDVTFVQKWIQSGGDIGATLDENKTTPLQVAAFNGHRHLVEYLIKTDPKLNINAVDEAGWTAFLCAASSAHTEVCNQLLNAGADPKIPNLQLTTALHYLCRKAVETPTTTPLSSSTNMLAHSSSATASIAYDTVGPNRGYFELLDNCLRKGIDINQQNSFGETPLMQACGRGNMEAVQWLLSKRAKWKMTNNKKETALYYAEKGGYTQIVKLLHSKQEQEAKKTLITHQNVKVDNYAEVTSIMRDSEAAVEQKDKKSFFITYKRVMLGSEVVDWVLKNLPIRTREEATEYGKKLVENHYIYRVNKKNKFKDSKNHMYKFSEAGEQPTDILIEKDKVGIEDFDQLKVLGKGGFGKVVLARKKDTDKIYALKLMDKQKILNKPRDFKNLMSEKRILQNDCCFLVHLHWAFQTETEFCLVMDFVGGGDLYYHWRKIRRFPEKVVQFIAAELVLALSYLHSCGIIYRDLKPQNILLDTDGHICLADFGLSKEVTQSIDVGLHTACGTPSYSAPEVLEGSPYGKSADYWSLGIVLYQFLCGKSPFEFDGDFAKLLRSIYSGDISYPKQIVSDPAHSFLEGLLCRDPRKRLDDPDVIKRHPFFRGVEFEKLEVKKLPSPIKVAEFDYAKNFDPKYTKMPVHDEKDDLRKPVPHVPEFSVMF